MDMLWALAVAGILLTVANGSIAANLMRNGMSERAYRWNRRMQWVAAFTVVALAARITTAFGFLSLGVMTGFYILSFVSFWVFYWVARGAGTLQTLLLRRWHGNIAAVLLVGIFGLAWYAFVVHPPGTKFGSIAALFTGVWVVGTLMGYRRYFPLLRQRAYPRLHVYRVRHWY